MSAFGEISSEEEESIGLNPLSVARRRVERLVRRCL